jgi:selenide,water dikinase
VQSLTALTDCGGCAAKYPARRLHELLASVPQIDDPALLVGLAPSDDAAVYRLDDERSLVFTLDFFPPVVDDPSDFGAIAAANALSDVFAMGAKPLLALSIAVMPETLEEDVFAAILTAASAQVRDAGGILAGGHTLRDAEPKYGLAVVGTVASDHVWTKAGARPGDLLYLTKPLGTGLIIHAGREREVEASWLAAAIESMRTLSLRPAELLGPLEPHAVTDVTGFGLLGHGLEVSERSGVRVFLDSQRLPGLPGAALLAGAGVRSGGHRRNLEFVQDALEHRAGETELALALDPQTSGGLLVAIPPERSAALEQSFAEAGHFLARVGSVEQGAGIVLA